MSCYFDLYCRSCKAEAGFHWNHGGEQLLAIWQHRAAFIELGKLSGMITSIDNTLPSSVRVDFELKFSGPESGGYEFPEFAAAHHDHDVVARDEYGYFSDYCQTWVPDPKWPNCSIGRCTLKINHEGDHVPPKEGAP